jgi:hypothetical protein
VSKGKFVMDKELAGQVARTPELAILIGSVVEEAAQAGINAAGLGGPVEIPEGMRAAARQRAMAFEDRGTVRA